MGWLDRLLGRGSTRREEPAHASPPPRVDAPAARGGGAQDPDEAAIARYRYMLRTAPPEQVEQAHREAFEKLTPEQRRQVLDQLATVVPESERRGDDARSLARTATRAEMRQPGTLVQVFNGGGYGGGMGRGYGGGGFGGGGFGGMGMGGMGMGGMGMGGMGLGGTLLTSVAGAFVGSAIADALIPDDFGNEHWGDDQAYEAGEEQGDDEGYDAGADSGSDAGADQAADVGYDGGFDDGGGFDGGGFDGGGFDDGGGDFGGDLDV